MSSRVKASDFMIVGGGIVGLGTALELHRLAPKASITLLEKEALVGRHQSTHNSGVLHCGLYYKPGSLKAKLAVSGIRRMTEFCRAHSIPHEICGKVVVAVDEPEVGRLKSLHERGTANGLRDLRWLSGEELREIEPNAAGLAALRVPEEGIVDYDAVCRAMQRDLEAGGVEVKTGTKVERLAREGGVWRASTPAGEFHARFIVNCAGLHCDRVAALAGMKRETRIVPFRGEYYQLRPEATHLVKHLIYPVPDPAFPFLGVHFTRMIQGGVEAGPNAVLAFAREGYTKWKIRPGDLADAVFFSGLWKFLNRHRSMAWEEIQRSFSKRLFCESLQRLVPAVQEADLAPGGAGVRAQAMTSDGTLVQDFQFLDGQDSLHVLNAPSPGATSSLAIGEHIAQRVLSSGPDGRPAA